MTKFKHLTIRNVILCEDIRTEIRNKKTLVGVYSGDIIVAEIPAVIELSFFLEGIAADHEIFDMEIRLSGPGKGAATGPIQLQAHGDSLALTLVSPKMQIKLDCEGIFKIALRDPEGPWKTVISRSIILNPEIANE